jgi:hypothetical protein
MLKALPVSSSVCTLRCSIAGCSTENFAEILGPDQRVMVMADGKTSIFLRLQNLCYQAFPSSHFSPFLQPVVQIYLWGSLSMSISPLTLI